MNGSNIHPNSQKVQLFGRIWCRPFQWWVNGQCGELGMAGWFGLVRNHEWGMEMIFGYLILFVKLFVKKIYSL
jgi:hypothetical protein